MFITFYDFFKRACGCLVILSGVMFVAVNFCTAEVSDDYFFDLIKNHQIKIRPGSYDWMAQHPESAQSYAGYIKSKPAQPQEGQNVIYITLLGDFDEARRTIIDQTARYIEVYYGLPVRFTDPVPLSVIPDKARRIHPKTGEKQILSTYVMEEVLLGMKPDDAFSLIAFTATDLWPGPGWNFVFGQADMEGRVGLWSIARNGDPHESPEAARLCLRRTISTGTHELGHMFGMAHCQYYECNLNGSNHRQESDRRPLKLCPICLRKLHWNTGMDPEERYRQLETLNKEMGLSSEVSF